jgi:outer membrane protein OmpA-like peptidoglycan-associated protein
MGMILQIPFGSGKTALSAPEIQALVAALNDPQIVRLRDDPTAVFVVLGYADSKGDDAKNIQVSQSRADSVVAAMKNQAKVANVTHAVAMGGSTLHDAQSLAGNRVVEVWAVLP